MNAQDPTQYRPQDPSSQNIPGSAEPVVPPPPSPEQQVGVRSMESDLESIHQTGGESPQPQIVSAPELSGQRSASEPTPQPQQPTPQSSDPTIPPPPSFDGASSASPATSSQPPVSPPSDQGPQLQPEPEPTKRGVGIKTILLVVLIFVVAAGAGYGIYYLISSLNRTPQVEVASTTPSFPVALPSPEESTSTPEETLEPQPIALVHQTFIPSPDITTNMVLGTSSLLAFRSAIASTTAQASVAQGSLVELAVVDASSTPVSSHEILSLVLPSFSSSTTNLFDQDITLWLYGDKVGGSKLGMMLKLNQPMTLDQASTTLRPAIEGAFQNLPSLFVGSVNTPTSAKFNDGQVNEIPVRFMVFDAKQGNVFEYAFVKIQNEVYLILTTSYNQMVDITNRLGITPQ